MTDLAYTIGDIFTWTFGILESLGNIPNNLFIVIIMVGLIAWMVKQQQYLKEDRQAGNII